MAERLLNDEVLGLIAAQVIKPEVFLYADFPAGARRIWTGRGPYDDGTNVWQGGGGFVSLDAIQETVDSGAVGIKVTLNGLDQELIDEMTTAPYQGRAAVILLGYHDPSTGEVMFEDEPLWQGTLNSDDVTMSRDATALEVNCEHRLVDILRKREFRYTHRDQQYLHPDAKDTGLSKMEAIQDLSIPWGRTQTSDPAAV